MTGIIQASALTRHYGSVVALDGISLCVEAGERVALVGHNGAGKTTLIKLILGLVPPTDGHVSILGDSPGSASVRDVCAYLPENLAFHGALTGREQLQFFARLRGEHGQVQELLEQVGLGEAMDRRIATYSKGMRQRLGLAQLFLGRPRLVILDEPTTGLDPVSRHQFYHLINELAERGAAIVQTSHILTELEARTDRIVIMREGKIVANGSLADLRRDADLPIRFRIRAADGKSAEIREKLGGLEINGTALEITTAPSRKMSQIRDIAEQGLGIEDVDIVQPDLEDLYLHYSGVEVGEGEHGQ